MRCPQCGHEAEGSARTCPACGYIMPPTLGQMVRRRPNVPARPLHGDAGAPQDPALNGIEFPDLPAIGSPDGLPGSGQPAEAAQRSGPLAFGQSSAGAGAGTRDRSHMPTERLPRSQPVRGAYPSEPLSGVWPATPYSGGMPSGALPTTGVWPAMPRADDPLGMPMADSLGPNRLPPVGPGTLLKKGRYHLAQRYSSAPTMGHHGEPEPPLFVASDIEQGATRVLMQELPVADLAPEEGEAISRDVVARLRRVERSPAFPTLLDTFGERRRWFLVFGLPAGERLVDMVRRDGPLPEPIVAEIGLRVLEHLASLDRLAPPLIHGNISANNILVDGGKGAKRVSLVGFSPTLLIDADGHVEHGWAGGSPGYAAPEQQRGQADRRADLFGLAATMYYAVTGRDPADQPAAAPPPVRKVNRSVSGALEEVLSRALRPAAGQRFQSVAEMHQALAPLAPSRGTRAGGDAPASRGAKAAAKPAAPGRPPRVPVLTGVVGALRNDLDLPPAPDIAPADGPSKAAQTRQRKQERQIRAQEVDQKGTARREARARKRRLRKATGRHTGLLVALLLLVVVGLGGDGLIYARDELNLPIPIPVVRLHIPPFTLPAFGAAPAPTPDTFALGLYHGKGIGLSGGLYIFDAQSPDASLKTRGAQALARGDVAGANKAFLRAMTADPSDAEAAIYAADTALDLAHQPAVTVVVGVAFGADDAGARAALQGAYLAQRRANAATVPASAVRLRILIANSGPSAANTATVAQLIQRALGTKNPLGMIGVVGWSESTLTAPALAALAPTGLPLVVPGAAQAGVKSAAYFALAPTLAQQAQALGVGASPALHSQRVLVLSTTAEAPSAGLAAAFVAGTQTAAQNGANIYVTAQDTFAPGTAGAAPDFSQAIQDAVNNGDDTIFLAGNASDVVALAGQEAKLTPSWATPPRILAPSLADTPDLLGVGTDAVAAAVRAAPGAMAVVNVAATADYGAWAGAGVAASGRPTFAADYTTQFGGALVPGGEDLAILSYDGVRLLQSAAATAATGAASGGAAPTATEMVTALAAIKPSAPFLGVGGAIGFTAGVPSAKAIPVLALAPISKAPATGPALRASVVAVLGGTRAFCGAAMCGEA